MAEITEKHILDWLDFDGVKFQIVERGESRVLRIEPVEGVLTEIRIPLFVDYLNQQLVGQKQIEKIERTTVEERLSTLEAALLKKKDEPLAVSVVDDVGTHDVFGESAPLVGEFNAMGFLFLDPASGGVKNAMVKFFEQDKSSRSIRKGEKIVFEVK